MITKEQLAELLTTDEGKGLIAEIAKEIGLEEVSGLKAKRDELLGQLKKAKEKIVDLEGTYADIDIDEYKALKETAPKGKPDASAQLEREFKKLKADLEKIAAEKESYRTNFEAREKELAITKAWDDAGLDSRYGTARQAHLSRAKVEYNDGKPVVIVDTGDGLGQSPQEYFKAFSQSDEGKLYVKQPVNKGANSAGFQSTSGKTMPREQFVKMAPTEQMAFIKDGGKPQD